MYHTRSSTLLTTKFKLLKSSRPGFGHVQPRSAFYHQMTLSASVKLSLYYPVSCNGCHWKPAQDQNNLSPASHSSPAETGPENVVAHGHTRLCLSTCTIDAEIVARTSFCFAMLNSDLHASDSTYCWHSVR